MMTVKLKWENVHYELELRSKYTVIQGDSATGKTSMWRYEGAFFESNVKCVFATHTTIDYVLESSKDSNTVLFIDEDLFDKLTNAQIQLMHHTHFYVVIICRSIPSSIPVDYREIYNLHASNNIHKTVRKYADLDKFVESDKYVSEDTNSGYQYFKNRLVNVTPAGGIGNVYKFVDKNTTAIIDGAACGSCISKILKHGKVYAPVSFEYLCYKKLNPNSELVKDPYKYWDFSEYKSLEEMFTAKLSEYCDTLGFHYAKKHCPNQILKLDLLPVQSNPKTIWNKYCKHFGIQNEEAEFQRLKNLYKVSDEELFKRLEEDFL